MSHRRVPQPRRIDRPREDLERALRQQYGFLLRSAESFDAGHVDESRRLALTVRVLVHDGNGLALLQQLGLRKRIRFVDTALKASSLPPGAIALGCEMAILQTSWEPDSTRYVAPLDDVSPERVNPAQRFSDWWTDKIMTGDGGHRFSRRDIVLGMANTDGGAHVDHALDEEFAALLASTGPITVHVGEEETGPQPGSMADAAMRQIAHEVRRTLDRDWRTSAILAQ